MLSSTLNTLAIAAGLLTLLLIALEGGFRAGRRAAVEGDPPGGGQVGAIQGAILGLLGLLLAFSFGGAAGRFIERQDLIVEEANAIGTAYLRADMLDEPHRTELREALRGYTEHRVEVSSRLRRSISPEVMAEIEGMHARIWSAAAAGATAKPLAMVAVLAPVNEVIDLHSTRVAAGRKHLPLLVIGLLVACSVLAIAVIGYSCGLGKRRRVPMTVSLTLLIYTALWVTIDLDHPRTGVMTLNDAPLKALKFDGGTG